MDRRTTLKLLGVGGTTLAVGPAAGCRGGATVAFAGWRGPPPDATDVRIRALSYATLAPNAHNTQPWLVALRPDALELFVDGSRLLPETDPPYRQTHISQGTFLELLAIALAEEGVASDVSYFPEGEYGNDVLRPLPVARLTLAKGAVVKDPLFSAITTRRSNKGIYDSKRLLSAEETLALARAPREGEVSVRIVDAADARGRIAALCTEAMAVEVQAVARNVETARWFRFSEREVEETRDGFGLAQTGRGALTRWFAETFLLDRKGAADPRGMFARGAIDSVRQQAGSAAAFGVLSDRANTRRAQVIAGRAYARIALTATALGLAMHPLSQALEEYPDMAKIKARLEAEVGLPSGGTVQMLFRLGHSDPTPHTPRRAVGDILRST